MLLLSRRGSRRLLRQSLVRIPAAERYFSPFPAQTSSADRPASHVLDTEVVTGGTVGLSHIYIVQGRNAWRCISPPLVCTHGVDSDMFTFI